MIVFNLHCSAEHTFEGWFASGEAFEKQVDQGLVSCPMCGDANIRKAINAPRINLGAVAKAPVRPQRSEEAQAYLGSQQMLMQQFRQFILANTENVGSGFAEAARRMHYGEEEHRNIRGKVSAEESIELRDEGIDTLALPGGLLLDESVQ